MQAANQRGAALPGFACSSWPCSRTAWDRAQTEVVDQRSLGARQQQTRHAAALAFAAGQAVDPCIQLVVQIEARQRVMRLGGRPAWTAIRSAVPHAPCGQAAGQHGGDHALARRQRRRLRRQEQSAAQAVARAPARLPGIADRISRKVPAAGRLAQASVCSRVVLPAPEGPIRASCSPPRSSEWTGRLHRRQPEWAPRRCSRRGDGAPRICA